MPNLEVNPILGKQQRKNFSRHSLLATSLQDHQKWQKHSITSSLRSTVGI